ncbi:response regulator [Planktothrix sp. FACHB-1355]|uniref:Circadian input-output histidine kinase CikA n=1 Tax=Aerosakkonema funiforme FACHB-1375 TaxID=2949571 RepID=A0A926VHL2_9CYAN|nr:MULTISPECIES: response regulator [Oscillatoriales]MBD2183932.1 response regulator [Aerosakkonema funiforme FACHB-1375]MBD3561963.1 response regulator [Planktothrix sp. FACHB-1355]
MSISQLHIPANILVVDDTPDNLRLLGGFLGDRGYRVRLARDGSLAIKSAQENPPDLILLDIMMPKPDGYEVCTQLKADVATSHIPIIFISAKGEVFDKVKAFSLGGVDYITKPFELEEVLARVENQLKICKLSQDLARQNALLQEEIRERRQIEIQLRNSENLKRSILNSAPVAICLTDFNGCLVEVNPAYTKLFGFEPAELIGKPFTNVHFSHLDAESKATILQQYQEFIKNNQNYHQAEFTVYRKDGAEVIVDVTRGIFQRDDGEFFVVATIKDITDRKKVEETLQKAVLAADAANRAKSEFLASMSHELRTPLNAILGFSQVLARDYSLKSQQQEYLQIINRSGEHLLSLINDILEMSKIEAGITSLNENYFDLFNLLDSIKDMFGLKAQSQGLQLIFDCASDIPKLVKIDERKLRQVLINILGNAIKFTQKGYVSLRVKINRSSRTTTENEQSTSNKDRLYFEIEDSGPGIAPGEIDKLFAPFEQTQIGRKFQQGTGLGLPISRKFVQLMGGDIKVISTVGLGSIFAFEIPVTIPDLCNIPNTETKGKVIGLAPAQPTYRILVVDDVAESRLLLVTLLTSIGFAVKEAENGQEAIELWKSWEPHLICMDMQMSVMNGYVATQKIKSTVKGKATAIIALTASAFETERKMILDCGCDDFICKPFNQEHLLDNIGNFLGVKYLYEDGSNPSKQTAYASNNSFTNFQLNAEDLNVLPTELLKLINEAALGCDDNNILKLIEQIPPENAEIARAIADLANNYQFELIHKLIQQQAGYSSSDIQLF